MKLLAINTFRIIGTMIETESSELDHPGNVLSGSYKISMSDQLDLLDRTIKVIKQILFFLSIILKTTAM